MRHSFSMRKLLYLIGVMILCVIQSSFLYQIFDVEQAFAAMSHEAMVEDAAGTDTKKVNTKEADAKETDTKEVGTKEADTKEIKTNGHESDSNEYQMNSKEEQAEEEPKKTEETEDVLSQLHKSDWSLILVNKQHPIPEDYSFTLGKINKSMKCDVRILIKLRQMIDAAGEEHITLSIKSPYRNEKRQEYLFNRKIKTYMKEKMSYLEAYRKAAQVVTLPGSSEHQIGLALDIVSNKYGLLEQGFGETQAGIWLENHAHEYGFILRYPKGKEDITGIEYEPWHFRYVGVPAATYIYENKITLEEFVQLLPE